MYCRHTQSSCQIVARRRDRWLTRQEAAHFLRTARRMRQVQFGKKTERVTGHTSRNSFLTGSIRDASKADLQRCAGSADHWSKLDRSRERHLLPAGDWRRKKKNKQQTPVRLPPGCCAPRRWKRKGCPFAHSSNGMATRQADQQGFQIGARAAGFGDDVIAPYAPAYLCNVAGSTRCADLGGCWLPWHDRTDIHRCLRAPPCRSSEEGRQCLWFTPTVSRQL